MSTLKIVPEGLVVTGVLQDSGYAILESTENDPVTPIPEYRLTEVEPLEYVAGILNPATSPIPEKLPE